VAFVVSVLSWLIDEPCIGTIRSNLDPFSEHDDVDLNDALRRAHLIGVHDEKPSVGEGGEGVRTHTSNRFTLDTPVDAEGSNFSVGERSLLSLARALVSCFKWDLAARLTESHRSKTAK